MVFHTFREKSHPPGSCKPRRVGMKSALLPVPRREPRDPRGESVAARFSGLNRSLAGALAVGKDRKR